MHARPVTLPLQQPGKNAVSHQVDGGSGRVTRLTLRETSGANPARLQVWDGTGTDGILLDTITLSADQSTRDYYKLYQYPYYGGLYLDVLAGTFEGSVVVVHCGQLDVLGEPVVMVNPEVLALDFTTAP